jgi:probable F420-dependent oxidoreductase
MFESFGVGLTLPQLGDHVSRHAVRAFCEHAEQLGFASLWAQEHLFFALEPQAPYAARPGMPVPDAYRTTLSPLELLAAAAAWTEHLVLGTGILVGGYHRPVELAQRIATLDHLSGGRVVLGLSVGWSKDEHDQMDVEFSSRGRRMDELVEAVLTCWGHDPVSFDGEFFTIPPSIVSPKPLQQPHPALLSGMRSPAGIRRTAAMFDIWNPASGTLDQITETRVRIDAMRSGDSDPIRVVQRIFTEPPFEVPGLEPMTIDQMCDAVRAAKAAGIDHLVVDTGFTTHITSDDDWAEFPGRLAPLLAAAAH